ncbi:cytochrome b [Herbaspirillum camelliae]|uniref:cytochrome b n=1 Tax=Herbaspirillum camelliae TaxID=1892903 RepID=UPI00094A10C5|nr:cytochrome b [Herbaspirillum camelliae]
MEKYSRVQIFLHWLVVLLVVTAYVTIEYRDIGGKGTVTNSVMKSIHFTCGSAILILMLVRLWLRRRLPPPAVRPVLPPFAAALATAGHYLLFILFISLPVLGLLNRYHSGKVWHLFWFTGPVAAVPNPAVAESLLHLHETLAVCGYWLIGLHVLAALYHHFIRRDNTLLRIMPDKRR